MGAAGAGCQDHAQEMKRPPRVVIDTNLVLSALVFTGGRLAPLRLA